jgi:hypothetical protein
MMRALLILLALAMPAAAQRASFDGDWAGFRYHECRTGGRVGQERVSMQVSRGEVRLSGMAGEADLTGQVNSDGSVALPGFGLFRGATGRFAGNRFTSEHPNRSGLCSMRYELERVVNQRRR